MHLLACLPHRGLDLDRIVRRHYPGKTAFCKQIPSPAQAQAQTQIQLMLQGNFSSSHVLCRTESTGDQTWEMEVVEGEVEEGSAMIFSYL